MATPNTLRCKKLYRKHGGKCQECGSRVVRVATVQKHRELVATPKTYVAWMSNAGTIVRCRMATVEHVIPKAEGGSNDEGNLELLCAQCNATRNARGQEVNRKWDPSKCRKCGANNPTKYRVCRKCRQENYKRFKQRLQRQALYG